MLGLVGLFGALLAGLAADALIGGVGDSSHDHDKAPPDAHDGEDTPGAGTDILDWLGLDGDPVAAVSNAVPTDAGDLTADDPDFAVQSSDQDPVVDPDLALQGGDQADILSGSGGNDTIVGGDGDDQLSGRDGNDFIQGGAGDDVAHGGAGDDTVQGGAGNDLVAGEDGNDKLVGGAGADSLLGQSGDDSLYGGAGADTLIGGDGNDDLVGGDAEDWLAGGLGNDHLTGDAGSDTLDGGAGNDTLDSREAVNAFPEMDFLNGGDGDDVLRVGAGDSAAGGQGSDVFELSDLAAGDAVANISDYNADEDRLVVVFDPTMHPDPQLSLEQQGETDDVVVLLDGVPLAMVQGGAGITLDDLLLTPSHAA